MGLLTKTLARRIEEMVRSSLATDCSAADDWFVGADPEDLDKPCGPMHQRPFTGVCSNILQDLDPDSWGEDVPEEVKQHVYKVFEELAPDYLTERIARIDWEARRRSRERLRKTLEALPCIKQRLRKRAAGEG